MSEKWNEIRKTGILVFLLSLPVMIWRSGKIGRILTIFSTTLILLWVVGKTSDTVINQVINKWEIRHESNRVFAEIAKAKEAVNSVAVSVGLADMRLRNRLEEKSNSYFGEIKERYSKMEDSIKQLESGLAIVSEAESGALKERIIELKERIVVGGGNPNGKSERLEFEKIIKNLSLLTDDEKVRFKKDLKDAGFFIERAKPMVQSFSGGFAQTSMDATSVMFLNRRAVYLEDSDSGF